MLAADCPNPVDPASLGIDLSQQTICDPLIPERCMLPFPNDFFTVADPTSRRTGRRVWVTPQALPKNVAGTPIRAVKRSTTWSSAASAPTTSRVT